MLIGTDGQAKASKSIGNVIMLSDDAETVEAKVRTMYTDPNRIRADIPGKSRATRCSSTTTPSTTTRPKSTT